MRAELEGRFLRALGRPRKSSALQLIIAVVDGLRSVTRGYFLSSAPGAGELLPAGRSEFQVSVPHFHFPSAFFSQTSTYLPRSLTGFPLASFMVSSYVPLTKPRSPDFATSTLVAFQLMTKPGLARRSAQTFLIASLVVAIGAFGGRTLASAE